MDRNRFYIGTYCLADYARDEAHIKDLKDCGIDFIANLQNDRQCLDTLDKFGVKAMLAGVTKRFDATSYEQEKALDEFCDHPAVIGFDIGDEPGAGDFAAYSKLAKTVKRKWPEKLPYLNLYPSYGQLASLSKEEALRQLGTKDYVEYIDKFAKTVDLDYICYDHYMYSNDVETAISDLYTVSEACKNTGRDMWIVLQVNSHVPDRWISENQLRFQAGSALCFGAKLITWACWTKGWWHNQVLDSNGEKTRQYERLKTVNHELKAVSEIFMPMKHNETIMLKKGGKTDVGEYLDIAADADMIVGRFLSDKNESLLISNASDPWDKAPGVNTLTFSVDHPVQVFVNGKKVAPCVCCSKYSVDIPTCGFALITAKTI